MARFRVELVQSIVETAVLFVEATNAAQAEELALEFAETGEPVETGGCAPPVGPRLRHTLHFRVGGTLQIVSKPCP
jgi:hypothetical protein